MLFNEYQMTKYIYFCIDDTITVIFCPAGMVKKNLILEPKFTTTAEVSVKSMYNNKSYLRSIH